MSERPQAKPFRFSEQQRVELARVLSRKQRVLGDERRDRRKKRGPIVDGHFYMGEPVTLDAVVTRLELLTGWILAGAIDPESWRNNPVLASLGPKRGRGRPPDLRQIVIINTIAGILAQSGVPLTRDRDGVLARTIELVLFAARRDVPADLLARLLVAVPLANYEAWIDPKE